jgi:circadian clock protein KaiB
MPAKLTLYVNGDSVLSRRAIVNLRRIIADYLASGQSLDIVDVTREPERAENARILATPTLVSNSHTSERRVTGDLSDAERVLFILELHDVATR